MTSPRDLLAQAIRANALPLTSDDRAERERAMTRILTVAERWAGNHHAPTEATARSEAPDDIRDEAEAARRRACWLYNDPPSLCEARLRAAAQEALGWRKATTTTRKAG